MAIIQCSNNHYYDDKRNDTCPYCEKLKSSQILADDLNEQLTSYIAHDGYDDIENDFEQPTEAYGEAVADYEKTIGIFTDSSLNLFTVGWLVCVKGAEKGKSYVIHSGRNFAGRSQDMDIILSDDAVARVNHFSVVYDPKEIRFYIVCGSANAYLNEHTVASQAEITDGDKIKAGESELIFIPFCREGRDWN